MHLHDLNHLRWAQLLNEHCYRVTAFYSLQKLALNKHQQRYIILLILAFVFWKLMGFSVQQVFSYWLDIDSTFRLAVGKAKVAHDGGKYARK
jgi:hypothetical protein